MSGVCGRDGLGIRVSGHLDLDTREITGFERLLGKRLFTRETLYAAILLEFGFAYLIAHTGEILDRHPDQFDQVTN